MAIKDYFTFNKLFEKPKSQYTKDWKLTPQDRQFKIHQMMGNSFGLQNTMAGIGGSSDVMTSNYNGGPALYSYRYLDNVYRTNLYARRIIDAPAQDMTRKWREFTYDDAEIAQARHDAEVGYCIATKVKDSVRYANLYGGSALLIVLDRDDPCDSELDICSIQKCELKKLQPVCLG